MKEFKDPKGVTHYRFNSVSEFMARPVTDKALLDHISRDRTPGFLSPDSPSLSYAQCMDLYRTGYSAYDAVVTPEYERIAGRHGTPLLDPQYKRKRRKKRGRFGHEFDVHTARRGQLDRAWTTFQHRTVLDTGRKPAITVVVNTIDSAGVNCFESRHGSAMLWWLCDLAQAERRPLTIYIAYRADGLWVTGGPKSCVLEVCVKNPLQPVNRKELAFASSYTFMRSYLFSLAGRIGSDWRVMSGLGMVRTLSEDNYPNEKVLLVNSKNLRDAGRWSWEHSGAGTAHEKVDAFIERFKAL